MQRQLPLQSLFIMIFLLGCGESKHLSEARKAAADSKSTDQEALQSIAAWCSWNPSGTRYTGANVEPWQDGYRVTGGYILNPQRRFIKSVEDFKHAVRVEAAAMVICMFRAGRSRKIKRIELSVALPLEQTSQLVNRFEIEEKDVVEIPNFENQRGPLDEKGLEFYIADSKLKATTDNWEGIIVRN